MGTIFFLSHQPGADLPLALLPGLDKLAHGFVYGVLAAAAIYAVQENAPRTPPGRTCMLVVLFCFLYGMTDEFHQSFVPGRDPSLGDLLADTAGAALMTFLWYRYGRPPKGPGASLSRQQR